MDTNTKIWLIPSVIFGAITWWLGNSSDWVLSWYWWALIFATPTAGCVIGAMAGIEGRKALDAVQEMNERDRNRER